MMNPWLFYDYKGLAQANSCNPLSWCYNMTGYNMINVGNPFSRMGLFMDQHAWDNRARSGQFIYAQPNLNYSFNGSSFNDSLFDQLIYKTTQESLRGTPYYSQIFNPDGSWTGNTMNFTNPYANMGYVGPTAPVIPGTESNDSKRKGNDEVITDKTEATHKEKFDKLSSFVKTFLNTDNTRKANDDERYLTDAEYIALNNALNAKEGSFETRYNALKEALEKVNADKIKKYVLESNNINFKVNGNANNLVDRLLEAGYELNRVAGADRYIQELVSDINNICLEGGIGVIADNIFETFNTADGIHILDLISSWNSSGQEKKLIEAIVAKYNLSDMTDTAKAQIKEQALEKLVNALINEANEAKARLEDEDAKKALDDAIKALNKSLENVKTAKDSKISTDLNTNFEKLYVLARVARTKILEEDLVKRFGAIDNRVFKDGMFYKELEEDLKLEKLGAVFTNAVKSLKAQRTSNDTEVTETAEQQVAKMIKDKKIEELKVKKDGNITVYQEKTMTGDSDGDGKPDYKKLYYIKDGKLVEWTNTKLNNDKFEAINPSVVQGEIETNIEEITENIASTEDTNREEVVTSETIINTNNNTEHNYSEPTAWKNGEDIAYKLIGVTNIQDRHEAKQLIMNITKEDVLVTLAGYEDNDAMGTNLIVHLLCNKEDNYTKTERQEMIKHILTCVKRNLEAQVAYKKSKKLDTSEIESHIKTLQGYITNGVNSRKEAKEIHEFLDKYVTDVRSQYETNHWFKEAGEACGNFFANGFDWFN